MAILTKTWTEIYNSYSIPVLPIARNGGYMTPSFVYFLKQGLISEPNAWTVLASSNRTVADTNDNWNSPQDIIYGGSTALPTWPGSWILLKSPTTPAIYLLLDYTAWSTYRWVARWSESQPDISSVSPYRVPPATGPEINQEWATTEPGSGSYEYYITMLKADDGSFIYIGTPDTSINDDNILMLNFLRETAPQDPHPYVIWQKLWYTTNHIFDQPNQSINNEVFSFAPNNTVLECSFEFPAMLTGTGSTSLSPRSADDPTRNFKPFSWPIRVISRTAGYEGFKGYLEDLWWAASEDPDRVSIRWGQSGFEGQNAVVCKRGSWWMPSPGGPFKW